MPSVEARGLRFHVQRIGGGTQCVVFLHGLVMDNLSSWYFTLATAVAQHADVVLYDLRGHGRSDRPDHGYGLGDMIEDLRALLSGLAVDGPVHLVGNSFGGLLAVAYALRYPEQVAGLVIVDGHLAGAAWGETMASTLSLEGEQRDRMIAESFRSWLGRHSRRKSNRLARNARELVYGTSLVGDLRSTPPLRDEELAGLRCPVLAIYGEHSDILDHGRRLERLVPSTTLRVVPGCSHSVLWERTASVCGEVRDWLVQRAAAADVGS